MLLEIDNVNLGYGSAVMAVQQCSLHVDEGQIVSLIGHNGAGKSTILKAIVGIVGVRAGQIRFRGEKIGKAKGFSAVRSQIAYVPEERGVFANLTVGENLKLGAVTRRDRRQVAQDLDRELDRFPVLRQYFGRGASLLSGGQQQQLVIARALLARPQLLLLDEPTLGLAPVIVDLIFDVIEQLRDEGVTVLLVEQNAVRAIEVSDCSYVLAPPGKVVGHGTAADLAANADVVEYLGFSPVSILED